MKKPCNKEDIIEKRSLLQDSNIYKDFEIFHHTMLIYFIFLICSFMLSFFIFYIFMFSTSCYLCTRMAFLPINISYWSFGFKKNIISYINENVAFRYNVTGLNTKTTRYDYDITSYIILACYRVFNYITYEKCIVVKRSVWWQILTYWRMLS